MILFLSSSLYVHCMLFSHCGSTGCIVWWHLSAVSGVRLLIHLCIRRCCMLLTLGDIVILCINQFVTDIISFHNFFIPVSQITKLYVTDCTFIIFYTIKNLFLLNDFLIKVFKIYLDSYLILRYF